MRLQRLSTLTLIAAILTVALTWAPAQAVPRQCVILEGFTQWNCGPCAGWNPTEASVMNQMTRDTVMAVKYHVSWPAPNNDIYHLWNAQENTARRNYYGIDGVPDMRLDGYITPPRNANTLKSQIRSEYGLDCPCTITLAALAVGESSINYFGTVNAEASVTGLRLYVGLITNEHHAPPQGLNGETAFYDVFRDMSPNASGGETITAGAGEIYDFEGTLNRDPDWEIDNMTVFAFVQNHSSRQIVQGVNTTVSQNYAFLTSTLDPRQQMVDPDGGEITIEVEVYNVGQMDDTYDVDLGGTYPDGWTYTVEAAGVPAGQSIQVPVTSLETADLVIRLNPNGNPGVATVGLGITTPNEPLIAGYEEFTVMGGLDILVVDDDEGDDFETYFDEALAPMEAEYVIGTWDLDVGYLDESFLSDIDVIVWFTGNSFGQGHTIQPLDQIVLESYLYNGGKLFLTGQGIGQDIRQDLFYSDILHAHYERNYPQGRDIVGIADDPISDGMSFSITGGDGADNQNRQTALTANDEDATPVFAYDGSDYYAGLRVEVPEYRVLYLGFGLEAIDNATDRELVMERGINWLLGSAGIGDDPAVTVPVDFELGQNFPNPFNPETTIPYSLAERSRVTINLFDVLGREVGRLTPGLQDAGSYSVHWNASVLPSGIYFYSLEAVNESNRFHSTRKLVLMK